MRIVNNKIYIKKGETPTYTASFISKQTGAPIVLTQDMFREGGDTLAIEFIVRPSSYSRDDEYNIRRYQILNGDSGLHIFEDNVIESYNDLLSPSDSPDEWDDDIAGTENRLYRRIDSLNDKFYAYYDDGHWHDYSLTVSFTFKYSETSIMEAKTYQYELTLFGGVFGQTADEGFERITYSKPLQALMDFVVEGSISG